MKVSISNIGGVTFMVISTIRLDHFNTEVQGVMHMFSKNFENLGKREQF